MQAKTFLLGAALAGAALAAHAEDGTIVITGTITDQTCTIEDPSPGYIKVVHLPTISKSALKNAGDVAGRTRFDIKLKDCPTTVDTLKLYFEPGPTTDYGTKDLKAYKQAWNVDAATLLKSLPSVTEAKGVQIRLMNLNGKQIPMGETEPNQHAAAFSGTMQAGQAKKSFTLQYLAGYVKKASEEVEATMLTTYVGFSVVYP
ncbi:fimbrial major subunit FimX [Bordetella bronchiseptica]|uniref:fimbrial major subunit FimX n=1 Tax=Bordetella bronchiseptica TaxID=518 RepID=UPI0004620855|nr:fimbrial major subunit FimX [Bordetella bronchiseptica]KDD17500.1 fimbrial protein FimX [Bordetella bronchiseptica MBORD707]